MLSLAQTIDWRIRPVLERFGDWALTDIKTELRLLAAAPARSMTITALDTGMRRGEIPTLKKR